ALHLRADQLIGAVWKRVSRGGEGLAVPAILWPHADGQPAWPVPCNGIGILRWLEACGRRLARLRVVALVEPAVTHHAGRAVVFACCYALAGYHPVRARHQFVANEAVAIVVALEQRDDLLHWWCSIRGRSAHPRLGAPECPLHRSQTCSRQA